MKSTRRNLWLGVITTVFGLMLAGCQPSGTSNGTTNDANVTPTPTTPGGSDSGANR